MSEWKLEWLEPDEQYIHFKLEDKDDTVLEFALQPPDHAKLYYALKDWFND